ncbi:uncharacterized protein LOC133203828 [Saccostrea echinata]|uniref:uncharacterized protein LOC133203828 n=1 Tax=Saccostrea echinata TaxID=191078 RepID=UPI002A8104F2|nr:uncharacterized protein LOC133203828 [Saccostrea echinata]
MTLQYLLALASAILFTLKYKTCFAKQCIESFPTIKGVKQCPMTEEAWLHAAKRKRCDALANIQTCVPEPDRFVYHCLVNQWGNGTVEVCAPIWILTGYCGYYDTVIGKIVNDVQKDCTTDVNSCPLRYNSSESFKYPRCYDVKKSKENTLGDCKSSTESQNEWMIIAIILAICSCIIIAVICWWSRRTTGKFELRNHQRGQNSHGQAQVNGEEALPLNNETSDACGAVSTKEDALDEKRTSGNITSIEVYGREFVYQATPSKHVYSSGSSNYINSDLLDTATSDGMETDKGENALSESYPRMPDTFSTKKRRRRRKKNKHHIDDFRVKGKGGKQ